MTIRRAWPPEEGDVWNYPYLWAWQGDRGETEGRKSRPCALVVSVAVTEDETRLFFLAITTQKPSADRRAIPIPETERHRANLATDRQLWIVLDEYNADSLERSYYLDPEARIGAFSGAFLRRVKRELLKLVKARASKAVSRR